MGILGNTCIYRTHLFGTFQLEILDFLLKASGVTEIISFRNKDAKNGFDVVNSYLWKY